MGNKSSSEINLIDSNINILMEYGIKMEDKNFIVDKNYVVSLYKTFYCPRHVLFRIDEMQSNHYHLRKRLRNQIKMYNKYNSTNINEDDYVENTYKLLKKTLRLIGV
jgi:hypothetical protein